MISVPQGSLRARKGPHGRVLDGSDRRRTLAEATSGADPSSGEHGSKVEQGLCVAHRCRFRTTLFCTCDNRRSGARMCRLIHVPLGERPP